MKTLFISLLIILLAATLGYCADATRIKGVINKQPIRDKFKEKIVMSKLHDVKTGQHDYVVMWFHASWCQPCRNMKPVWNDKAVQDVITEKYDAYLVDIDNDQTTSRAYKVSSVPYFIIGKRVNDKLQIISAKTGGMSKATLIKWLKETK